MTKNVIIVNRGRGTDFSGIENARMLYGDKQEVKHEILLQRSPI